MKLQLPSLEAAAPVQMDGFYLVGNNYGYIDVLVDSVDYHMIPFHHLHVHEIDYMNSVTTCII